jgi:hypothetical protein
MDENKQASLAVDIGEAGFLRLVGFALLSWLDFGVWRQLSWGSVSLPSLTDIGILLHLRPGYPGNPSFSEYYE